MSHHSLETDNPVISKYTYVDTLLKRRSQWRSPVAACLLGLRVRISPGPWMFVSCKCCVLLQVEADHSYRVVPSSVKRVIVFNLETSTTRRPWPLSVCFATGGKNVLMKYAPNLGMWKLILVMRQWREVFWEAWIELLNYCIDGVACQHENQTPDEWIQDIPETSFTTHVIQFNYYESAIIFTNFLKIR